MGLDNEEIVVMCAWQEIRQLTFNILSVVYKTINRSILGVIWYFCLSIFCSGYVNKTIYNLFSQYTIAPGKRGYQVNIPAGTQRWDNVASTSMRRHDVTSTLMRRCIYVLCLLGCFLISPQNHLMCNMVKRPLCHMRTAKFQMSVRIRAAWFGHSMFMDVYYSIYWCCKRVTKAQISLRLWARD